MTPDPPNIEYFRFEEDFIEDNIRCIPMIVRLKLDTIGIKLTLKAWSRFNANERTQLAIIPCATGAEIERYNKNLRELAKKYSIEILEQIGTEENAIWNKPDSIPVSLIEKFIEFNQHISLAQWRSLSKLQRFALVKLSRPGHESRNFKKAMIEFELFNKET